MLAEAFLSTVMYREIIDGEIQQDRENNRLPNATSSEDTTGAEKKLSQNHGATPGCAHEDPQVHEQMCHRETIGPLSEAVYIPKRNPVTDNNLDLYTSWSSMYTSIYRNYPDLHIGGDHILNNKKDSGCVLDLESDFQDGPVLLSVDIDSSRLPDESLVGSSAEGVLHSEESNMFPPAPFSNSILNGFIEKKMQELYKQCYEENLLTNASPNPMLWSSTMKLNVNQMSLQLSQEQNIEPSRAKKAILQCLCCATSGGSSEFITPILLISSQETRKQSGTLSRNSARRNSCAVHSRK